MGTKKNEVINTFAQYDEQKNLLKIYSPADNTFEFNEGMWSYNPYLPMNPTFKVLKKGWNNISIPVDNISSDCNLELFLTLKKRPAVKFSMQNENTYGWYYWHDVPESNDSLGYSITYRTYREADGGPTNCRIVVSNIKYAGKSLILDLSKIPLIRNYRLFFKNSPTNSVGEASTYNFPRMNGENEPILPLMDKDIPIADWSSYSNHGISEFTITADDGYTYNSQNLISGMMVEPEIYKPYVVCMDDSGNEIDCYISLPISETGTDIDQQLVDDVYITIPDPEIDYATIQFVAGDGGNFSTITIKKQKYLTSLTTNDLPTPVAKDHYAFIKWSSDFKDHVVIKNEVYTATYEYIAATVHFNTNGGEAISDRIIDRGNGIGSVTNPRHKTGVFVGWYSDSGLTNAVDLNTWRMPTPAVETTFYAKYDTNAAKAVVSYVVNGGAANPSSIVKVLVDADGFASTSGSASLIASDIPTISANTGYDINLISYNPKRPEVGDRIIGNTTYTITLDKISTNITITLGTNMSLTLGQLNQTVKYGDRLADTIITCNDGYAWTDSDIANIKKALPFEVSTNEHKNTLTFYGVINTTNKTISYTLPNPSPTVNYKPDAGNNLVRVSVKEPSGSYTNWSQWTSPASVIPKYDFSKPMRLNYTNLQTGGINASWAMFGDHPFSNLTTNNHGHITTSTNQVEIAWRFSDDQVTLVNSHIGEVIMIYDDAGKKSGFVFEVSGANAPMVGVVKFVDWPEIPDVALKADECLWDTSFNYETYELIDMYNVAHPDNPCTWVEASIHPGTYFQPQHFTMPNPTTTVEVRAKFGTEPNEYGLVTIDNSPNGNVLRIPWNSGDGFDFQLNSGYIPLSKDGCFVELYLEPDFRTLVYSLTTEHPIGGSNHWWMPYPPRDMRMYAKFVKDESKYLTIYWGRDSSMSGFGPDAKWKTPIPWRIRSVDGGPAYMWDPLAISCDSSRFEWGLSIGDLEGNRPIYTSSYVDIQHWSPDPDYMGTVNKFNLFYYGYEEMWNETSIYDGDDAIVLVDSGAEESTEYRLMYTGNSDIEQGISE